MSGKCDIDGPCVSSTNFPVQYGETDWCTISILENVIVHPSNTFDVEVGADKDILTINGVEITDKSEFPETLLKGSLITWTTDIGAQRAGWEMCFEELFDPTVAPSQNPIVRPTSKPSVNY